MSGFEAIVSHVVCPTFHPPNDDEIEMRAGNYSVSIANAAIRFIKDQGTFTADNFVALE